LPTYRHRTVLEIGRGLRAFLNLYAGLVRGEVPDPERQSMQLAQARNQIKRLRKQLSNKNGPPARSQGSSAGSDTEADRIKAENVVWIFGSPRTGSTWLSDIMEEVDNQTVWREPMVGSLFGTPYYVQGSEAQREARHKNKHFILGRHREAWLRAVRFTVLDGAAARFPNATEDGYLIIKEPNGSMGAPLLMEALPESRMLLLVRDPRDAVASALDSAREGGWWADKAGRSMTVDDRPAAPVDGLAKTYVLHVGNAKMAYEAHQGLKVLVRYEDLRSDTLGEMERIYSTLGIAVDKEELAQLVEKHSWENIPTEDKGQGKFYRKASPGSWKEDLSPQQVEVVERITGPLLKEFYP
jgi:hypothetical protein